MSNRFHSSKKLIETASCSAKSKSSGGSTVDLTTYRAQKNIQERKNTINNIIKSADKLNW